MEAPSSTRFALPVSDELEGEQTTIPDTTKAATVWGVGIFSNWDSKWIVKAASIPEIRSLRPHCWEWNERKWHIGCVNLFWK